MTATAPPDESAVREACRYLEGQPGITVCGELRWFDSLRAWALPIRLAIAKASSEVPGDTLWYAVIDAQFPYGMIELFPARDGGLKGTWPHQDINTSGDAELRWTEGDICVAARVSEVQAPPHRACGTLNLARVG